MPAECAATASTPTKSITDGYQLAEPELASPTLKTADPEENDHDESRVAELIGSLPLEAC